jgi:hypothetical protein
MFNLIDGDTDSPPDAFSLSEGTGKIKRSVSEPDVTKVYLDMCREDGIEPAKDFSGRFKSASNRPFMLKQLCLPKLRANVPNSPDKYYT